MFKSLLTILILTALFFDSFALTCKRRDPTTAEGDNGEDRVCTSTQTTCYSFTSSGNTRFGNCGNCPGAFADCYVCNTDGCNTVTPSAISCFDRLSGTSYGNGSSRVCHTGVTSCYSYIKNSLYYGGCGNCSGMPSPQPGCETCASNNCNAVPPSVISCYYRNETNYSSSINGESVACPPEISSCYSYINGTSRYANCGNCTSVASNNCSSCTTSNCNSVPVSTISCFNRTGSTSNSNGTMMDCNPGISSCYSYEDGTSSYAACGTCTSMQVSNFGCTSCNTTSCNSKKMSDLSKSASVAGTNVKTAVIGVLLLAMMKFY